MTDQYAVFGNPIAHSKSPMIHALFAAQTKQDIEYTKQLVELGQFERAATKFFDDGGKGLNITVPFKLDAFAFAEKNGFVSERAKLAGAVNTLKKMDDGKIFGDNTDGVGLVRDITQNLGWDIEGKHILILGAGGAVRGILAPLLAEQPEEIVIANRTLSKAEQLRDSFRNLGKISIWDNRKPISYSFDITINGSSASLKENEGEGDLSNLVLAVQHPRDACAYDMVYGIPQIFGHMTAPVQAGTIPLRLETVINHTPFLGMAESYSIQNRADGLGMLVEQAAESFFIWRGVRPETKSVIDYVRKQL